MSFEEVFALCAMTGLVHIIALTYLVANMYFLESFPEEGGVSFRDIGETFIDLFVMLSPLSYLPVEFLTRRKIKPTSGTS